MSVIHDVHKTAQILYIAIIRINIAGYEAHNARNITKTNSQISSIISLSQKKPIKEVVLSEMHEAIGDVGAHEGLVT